MNGSLGSAQTMPVGVVAGSVEQAVSTLGIRLEQLGVLTLDLESSLYQVLREDLRQDAEGSAGACGKSCPSTPLASRLKEIIAGIESLTSRVESIRGRVDI